VNGMRRPSTSKRILLAIERGLDAVDYDSLDRLDRADHRRALKWLRGIRQFNRARARERAKWDLLRLRAERNTDGK